MYRRFNYRGLRLEMPKSIFVSVQTQSNAWRQLYRSKLRTQCHNTPKTGRLFLLDSLRFYERVTVGTNDTKTYNWNQERFKKDYQNLIDTIQSIPSKPQIILVKPVPAFETKWTINDSTLVNGVNPVIDELQVQYKLHVIDMHDAFLGEAENFIDSIHPNEIAVYKMAEMVYKEIKNIEK